MLRTKAFALILLTTAIAAAQDPYEKEGNIAPTMIQLTACQEAEILNDTKVADGFEVTVFAAPPMVNYPVFVAAAPDGTLYVSSDGNGSLGRDPKRGRVIRLRDLDGDGRADETKVFCEIDAPRGLVWDHDRLYLVHPPHLSVFIDKDGDGVSDEQQVLVQDIAFSYKDRPADHTTNGLTLGIDGWLYIAGGDFGFMKATGTDGRTLQHRGGGVIRVRPDGTGLELFNTGTRNILEVAISPLMDLFARDNTNDGGGWDVRFHHLTGLAEHGYPRLYKNFPDESIKPLADYGGGSGCGAVYIDEPGFGEWNKAPFTADWGTGALWHHLLKAKGATFEEVRPPEPFIRMTRPTDADVDAMSRVYCASWKGATFKWEGAEVGYIVCATPKGYEPKPLPDFGKASEGDLLEMLALDQNPSHRRRLEAVRELERRGLNAFHEHYAKQFAEYRTPERNQLDEFYNLANEANSDGVRALVSSVSADDAVTSHTAIRAIGMRGISGPVFEALDQEPGKARELLRALALIHTPEVAAGLIDRLGKATDSQLRRHLLAALCRLHFHEGAWKGDSWGTRPDTRGPYYQPEPWSETPMIAAALNEALSTASADEAAFLVKEMSRNRIQSNEALQRMLSLARQNPKILPEAVAQLAAAEEFPAEAVTLLVSVLKESGEEGASTDTMANAIVALAKTDSAEGCLISLTGLHQLSEALKAAEQAVENAQAIEDPVVKKHESKIVRTQFETVQRQLFMAMRAYMDAPKLENHHQQLEAEAERIGEPSALWADAALLKLSERNSGSPEAREMAANALQSGWKVPARRAQIIAAAAAIRHRSYAEKIREALKDPDARVREAAERASKVVQVRRRRDRTPKIETLKPEEVLAAVLDHQRGDASLGEQIFTRATCNACHSVSQEEPQKGPYLGNISQTYKRPELAQNIIDPNKTIAQGFTSQLITMNDGAQHLGFITLEGAEEVKLRNILAEESTLKTSEIQERQKLPTSMMPPGLMMPFTVHEFASLLDYLESLAKN